MAEPKREGHEKLMQIKVMAQRASVMKALSAWRTIVLGYRVDPEASLAACGWPMAPSARPLPPGVFERGPKGVLKVGVLRQLFTLCAAAARRGPTGTTR